MRHTRSKQGSEQDHRTRNEGVKDADGQEKEEVMIGGEAFQRTGLSIFGVDRFLHCWISGQYHEKRLF